MDSRVIVASTWRQEPRIPGPRAAKVSDPPGRAIPWKVNGPFILDDFWHDWRLFRSTRKPGRRGSQISADRPSPDPSGGDFRIVLDRRRRRPPTASIHPISKVSGSSSGTVGLSKGRAPAFDGPFPGSRSLRSRSDGDLFDTTNSRSRSATCSAIGVKISVSPGSLYLCGERDLRTYWPMCSVEGRSCPVAGPSACARRRHAKSSSPPRRLYWSAYPIVALCSRGISRILFRSRTTAIALS